MKSTSIILPLTIVAGLSTPLIAQDGGPPPRPGHPPVPPLVQALDRDEDGVISKYELKRATRALSKLDENRDGELTRDEVRPPHPPRDRENPERHRPRRDRDAPDDAGNEPEGKPDGQRQGPPPSPIFQALDADRDGAISDEELENAPEALAELDANEDGELTRDELRPPHPGGQPPQDDGPPEGDGPPPHEDDDAERRPGPPRGPRR
jgi:hypothetical protein